MMVRRAFFPIAAALIGAVTAGACGDDETTTSPQTTSSGNSSSASGTGGGTGGGGGCVEDSCSCIQPGDMGNDLGVGHYCTPGGMECDEFPLAPQCLADVGQDQWFCTRIFCDATDDCGDGAGCLIDPQGSACVPCKCDDSGVGCTGGSGPGGAGGSGGS